MKWVKGIAAFAILIGCIWVFWLSDQVAYAKIAAAYGAKKVCSCLYVGESDMEMCREDFTEDVGSVRFTDNGDSVSASVLGGLVSETAIYVPDQGCRLIP